MSGKLYIFCGIPFSGKTTLSKEVARQRGYKRIDLDEVKFELYGKGVQDDDLQQKDWDIVYQMMYKQIEDSLKAGETTIHDTGNFTRHERDLVRNIADKQGVEAVSVFVNTSVAVAKKRLMVNQETNMRFNVTEQEFQEAVDEIEPPDKSEPHFVYEQGTAVDSWIAKHFA